MLCVPIERIGEFWPRIRPFLDQMAHLSDGWIAEDVYCYLKSGLATLYVAEGEWRGFAVLQLLPHYSSKRLHCWIVQTTDDPQIYMEEVEKIARQAGAHVITFDSPRKGWEKRAKRLGFRPTMIRYTKELQ
jgi:hypothetical protein